MMTAPRTVLTLVERFAEQIDSYKTGDYKEASLRREFLDPFFAELGWDIYNKAGYAEAYKEVVHEDTLRIGGAVKAPDYCFRIGGVRKFFLEAKKPSIAVKDDVSAAYQLRRYAWSAKLPLSILSDFEEFAVYDCRIRPNLTDKAATARVFYCTFRDYPDKWDWIHSVFSRDAILKGSFDRYAETNKGKRGTAEVDADFLRTIESWRNDLARNLALRNPALTQRELNFAVQRIIDRIIFLRICEDRGIEDYGRLLALSNGNDIYKRLGILFREADKRYNSGLFHFKAERDIKEPPDEITLNLAVDDKLLRDMLRSLYYPESPYEFSVLPADILGHVYEQFLGKVIRLTEGHRAVIEEKPEVRKAGGVYYTPTYIVEYIVRETVGKLTEGKTPKEMEKLRILDPACGSGSFLIGAYQYLLDRHLAWYLENDPERWARGKKPALVRTTAGWKLTIAERKRILLNNIYGVDIDSQAVEVTKLSLLLKVLEGETEQSVQTMINLFGERALPDLGSNIKCGNSLIGPDFYAQAALPEVSDEERLRVNVFDWEAEFPDIFKAGGFDAVIGNPPYGNLATGGVKGYLGIAYREINPLTDYYGYFISKGAKLLNKNGLLGYIVPSAWLGGPAYKTFRTFCLERSIQKIVCLPFDVFRDAYVDTLILVFSPATRRTGHKVQTYSFSKKQILSREVLQTLSYQEIEQIEWVNNDDSKIVLDAGSQKMLASLRARVKTTFADLIEMRRGVLFDAALLTPKKQGKDSHPYFEGNIYRYVLDYAAPAWIEFNDNLKERPKEFKWFEGERILLRRLVNRQQRLMAMITDKTFITNKNLYSVRLINKMVSLWFVLGVLNSRLLSHLYIKQVSQATKDDYPQVTIKDVLSLPVPIGKQTIRDQIASLAKTIVAICQQSRTARVPEEKAALDRQIAATDAQIDRLVYDLYSLTEEEIKIVEGGLLHARP